MVTYQKDEIVSATQIVRNFSEELRSLTSGEKQRVVVVKNNRFEAVMITLEQYEKMSEAVAILEKIYKKTKFEPNG